MRVTGQQQAPGRGYQEDQRKHSLLETQLGTYWCGAVFLNLAVKGLCSLVLIQWSELPCFGTFLLRITPT